MKTLVVAVSGGIDSVVLLHKLVQESSANVIVAHFDHGIRPESDADARFVEGVARLYGLHFEGTREELGKDASEAIARERRYIFLRSVARKHNAQIATAHHQDDVIETVVINSQRGTGWRGLAVLDSNILRPLLDLTKQDIRAYALVHRLEWVEDETNMTNAYLRNRVRATIASKLSSESKRRLVTLWENQRALKRTVDEEVENVLEGSKQYARYFFTHIDEATALELLRAVLLKCHVSLTRPQRQRLLHAIKVAKAGSRFEAGEGVTVRFSLTTFIVETLPSVV